MKVRELGSFIRNQRVSERLSLRGLSRLAGVSIPYLSQVERGLRRPSAEILQAIAKALRISAETLYVQAGILDQHPVPDVVGALMADPTITERQKQALIQIYDAFREEAGAKEKRPAPRRSRAVKVSLPVSRTAPVPREKLDGRAKTKAARSPHPAPLRPPVTKPREEV
jgi:transcriptional regulator with XRE-family HTH domain